jgi:hypothetical protein
LPLGNAMIEAVALQLSIAKREYLNQNVASPKILKLHTSFVIRLVLFRTACSKLLSELRMRQIYAKPQRHNLPDKCILSFSLTQC